MTVYKNAQQSYHILYFISTLALLSEMVTLTVLSFKTNSSGDGRKSVTTLTFPMGSFVYAIFFSINILSFPPVAGTYDSNCQLRLGEGNSVLFLVLSVLVIIPLEKRLFIHEVNIL